MEKTYLVSRTFQEFTPESIEQGDSSDNGFVWQDRELTFDECVRELQECSELSAYPIREPKQAAHVWASTDLWTDDYSTGTQREESVHIDAPAEILFEMFSAAELIK